MANKIMEIIKKLFNLFKKRNKITLPEVKIFWSNGSCSKHVACYNETIEQFKYRILETYGPYSCTIILYVREQEILLKD